MWWPPVIICPQGAGVGQGSHSHAPVSSQELLYYNSVSSLPLLLILVCADGSAQALPNAYAVVSRAWS
jgi:hypothetical protein